MFPYRLMASGWLSVALIFSLASGGGAEDWPGWRGPRGDGTSSAIAPPVHWDATSGKNIAWKAAIPGVGHSSPVIWGESVFLTTCLLESQERVLLCLDRRDGQPRWQRTVITAPLESKHARNSYASGTPAADGELVYVAFLEVDGTTVPAPNVGSPREITPGQMVVAAYDFDGNQKWIVRPGGFVSAHGFCSNPVLFEDLVIVNGDHDGDSYVVALDKHTGATVWKQPRAHQTRSYATPLIRQIDGQPQMALSGSKRVVGMDPRDGQLRWHVEGPTEQYVASMVYDGRYFFMAAGFPTYHVMAIRPDGHGDVTESHVAWHTTDARCYVPSPVLAEGFLFVADDRGTAAAFDAATGERLWRERLGREFSASLVTAAGLVYFVAEDGATHVVDPQRNFEKIAENPLGESTFASPAIARGQFYIRGEAHLFCIGTNREGVSPDDADPNDP